MINKSRGRPALQQFIEDAFMGTLVTDCWAACHAVTGERRQCDLAHLLRELERTGEIDLSAKWQAFVGFFTPSSSEAEVEARS